MTKPTRSWTDIADNAVALSRGPIARASVMSLGIRLTGLGLAFLQAILTARLLGPAGYGMVATILSAAQVLAYLAMFGFGPLAVREIPAFQAKGNDDELAGFLRLSLGLTFGLSALLALLAVAFVIPTLLDGNSQTDALAFGGLLVIPFAMLALLRGWAQGFGRVANAQVPAEVLRPAIMVAVMLAALVYSTAFTMRDYLFVALVGGVLAAGLSLVLLWAKEWRKLPTGAQSQQSRTLLVSALPFMGIGLATMLQSELNTLLLASMSGPEQTGLFQPIARFAPLLMLPAQAATMRYSPRVSELWQKQEIARLKSITWTFSWTTTALTLGLGLLVGFGGPWLMLAFGEQFVEVASLLFVIAAAQVLGAAFGPAGVILTMSGKSRHALAGMLVGLAINALLAWFLIPQYGVAGAVWAFAVGIVIAKVWMAAALAATRGINSTIFALGKTN